MGKKGAFYSPSPKTSRWAFSGRRLRCAGSSGGPDIPSGGAETPAMPETPGTLRGCSGPPTSTAPHRRRRAEKSWGRSFRVLWTGDSGGPETPVGRRLRSFSGGTPDPSPVPHHSKTIGSENTGTGDSGPMGRRLRCDGRLPTISGLDQNSENQNCHNFCK